MNHDEKACPFCAETIKAAALKCKHCGEAIKDTSATRPVEKPEDQSAFLLPGICIVAGAVLFFYSLSMETSVSTSVGAVSNLSLMSQQGNMKMAGGFLALLGMFWAAMKSQSQGK
jgi:hypothetical protein